MLYYKISNPNDELEVELRAILGGGDVRGTKTIDFRIKIVSRISIYALFGAIWQFAIEYLPILIPKLNFFYLFE